MLKEFDFNFLCLLFLGRMNVIVREFYVVGVHDFDMMCFALLCFVLFFPSHLSLVTMGLLFCRRSCHRCHCRRKK